MTDWNLILALVISTSLLQYIGWKIARKISLIHQLVGWIQEDIQIMRKLGDKPQ